MAKTAEVNLLTLTHGLQELVYTHGNQFEARITLADIKRTPKDCADM